MVDARNFEVGQSHLVLVSEARYGNVLGKMCNIVELISSYLAPAKRRPKKVFHVILCASQILCILPCFIKCKQLLSLLCMICASDIDLVQSHRIFLHSIRFDGNIMKHCGMEISPKHATHSVCIFFRVNDCKYAGCVKLVVVSDKISVCRVDT
jgi:hypothetical protein